MNELLKKLIEAVDGIDGLLIEGLTDTQNENWKEEIDKLFFVLTEARTAVNQSDKP